MIEIMF